MRMDKLTSRFQQALADAQSLAVGRDHNMLEPVHVMAALLHQQGGPTAPLRTPAQGVVPARTRAQAARLVCGAWRARAGRRAAYLNGLAGGGLVRARH